MRRPRSRWPWALAMGLLAASAALTLPSVASASIPRESTPLPPPDTCIAPILPCYILLSISSGSHGNSETVSGYRFWPGEPFTVYFWNGNSSAAAPAVASGSTGAGSFTATFNIPKEPVGSYTIFVTDLAGDNQSAAFQLTHLIATPSSGPGGNTTSVSGQGFLPDHVVKFHLHGVHATTASPCRTNATGDFTGCVVTIPNVTTGATRLTATDGTYWARIDFVVS